MPKPTFLPKYQKIESKIIEILLRGHHRWRSDLHYPESHSDMQGAVRELMAVLDIKDVPEDLPRIEIDQRIQAMIDDRGIFEQMEEKPAVSMVEKKTWKVFQAVGLLWWVNRLLHTFGWAIVYLYGDENNIIDVYPARVKFRGFSNDVESDGFVRLSEHIKGNIDELVKEASE